MYEYPFNSNIMSKEFLKLFLEMYEKKDILLSERTIEKSTILEKKLYTVKRYLKN